MNKSFHTIIAEDQVQGLRLIGLGCNAVPIEDYPRLCRVEFFLLDESVERPRAEWNFYQVLEDGFIKSESTLRWHENIWYLERNRESRSCDGPLTQYDEWRSHGGLNPEGRESPLERISSFQRDVYAERMGY
jgi:hypothetical protein